MSQNIQIFNIKYLKILKKNQFLNQEILLLMQQ